MSARKKRLGALVGGIAGLLVLPALAQEPLMFWERTGGNCR